MKKNPIATFIIKIGIPVKLESTIDISITEATTTHALANTFVNMQTVIKMLARVSPPVSIPR